MSVEFASLALSDPNFSLKNASDLSMFYPKVKQIQIYRQSFLIYFEIG